MNKFAQIAALESEVKEKEIALAWAIGDKDHTLVALLYLERKQLLHELSQVGQ